MSARTIVAVAAVAMSVTAFAQVWHLTRGGPGVSHDSVDYLAAAGSLGSGHGLTLPYASYNEVPPQNYLGSGPIPMTSFPPLFPALIAGASKLTAQSDLTSARWLNALSLACTVLLVGVFVWRQSRSWLWTIAAMSAILFEPDQLLVSSMVWSEPSAILLGVATLFALTEYVERPRLWILVAAACLAGGLILDRYAAIAVIPVGVLAIWLARTPGRVRLSLLFCVGAFVPLAGWLIRNQVDGVSDGRSMGWHPPALRAVGAILHTAFDWLSPLPALRVPILCALLLAAGLAVTRTIKGSSEARTGPLALLGSFLVLYVLVLGAAVALFDLSLRVALSSSALNHRLLAPLYAVGVVLVACVLAAVTAQAPKSILLVVLPVVGAVCALSLAHASSLESGIPDRFVYTAPPWRDSAALVMVRRVPDGDLLITNAPDFVWLRTGRVAIPVPRLYSSYTGLPNHAFGREVNLIADAVDHGRRGWAIAWSGVGRPYLPSMAAFRRLLRLREVSAGAGGRLLQILPSHRPPFRPRRAS